MIYGNYLFFLSDTNLCLGHPEYKNDILYVTMLIVVLFGNLLILHHFLIIIEVTYNFVLAQLELLHTYNFQVLVLRSISKFQWRTGIFHGEKECIVCWEPFKNREYITRLNCH
jgi:hypothetical protein